MKKKKIILIGIAIFIAIIVGIVFIVLANQPKDNSEEKPLQNNNVTESEVPKAPATNTEKLLDTLDKVEVKSLNNDSIEFAKEIDISEGEKVAVWVYSEPKFLGYFIVIIENGIKKIEGLEKALQNISIDNGNHNIAIVSEQGEKIGYIDVYIEGNELFKDKASKTTTKEVVEEKEIAYETITEKEINMLSGTKEIITKGEKGIKKITYKVTYDGNGKEISKEKISEKISKNAVNQVEKVGISDFNINTDYINGTMQGFYCTEEQTYTASYDNLKHCNDEQYTNLNEFSMAKVKDSFYITKIKDKNITKAFNVTKVNNWLYSGEYDGTLYYFDTRAGDGEPIKLTKEICQKYNLSCGEW